MRWWARDLSGIRDSGLRLLHVSIKAPLGIMRPTVSIIVTASGDRTPRLWSAVSGRLLAILQATPAMLRARCFTTSTRMETRRSRKRAVLDRATMLCLPQPLYGLPVIRESNDVHHSHAGFAALPPLFATGGPHYT